MSNNIPNSELDSHQNNVVDGFRDLDVESDVDSLDSYSTHSSPTYVACPAQLNQSVSDGSDGSDSGSNAGPDRSEQLSEDGLEFMHSPRDEAPEGTTTQLLS